LDVIMHAATSFKMPLIKRLKGGLENAYANPAIRPPTQKKITKARRSSDGLLWAAKSRGSLKKLALAPVATKVVIVFGAEIPATVTFCAPMENDF
jgi:hypothetical protein